MSKVLNSITPVATKGDKGLQLQFIKKYEDATEVHFCKGDISLKQYIYHNVVDIPDEVFDEKGDWLVYIYVIGVDYSKTTDTYVMKVDDRHPIPDGVAPEHQQSYEEKLQQIFLDTKAIAEDVKKRADNGEFDGKDYVLTEEDKKEIAGMVETEGDSDSGTTNYKDLTNKPSINGVVLQGNQSLQTLGLQGEALYFNDYSSLISEMLRATNNEKYSYPRYIHIKDNNVPDLWVVYVGSDKSYYTFTTNKQFIADIKTTGTSGLKVGYCYVLLAGGEFVTPEQMKNAIEDAIGNAIGGAY